MQINAKGMHYRKLNAILKEAAASGVAHFELENVNGQRYLGTGLDRPVEIVVNGVPGNDLGAFMDGPTVIVRGNGQDAIANTMNAGKIVVHGHAGDVLAFGMRGGKLFIKGDVGYRVGIHMKAYNEQAPVVIIGGGAGAFFGEYMAGGVLVLLGLGYAAGQSLIGDYTGTGMHGGVIYIRGKVDPDLLGKEVAVFEADAQDREVLEPHLLEYCQEFGLDPAEINRRPFQKLVPVSHRPYGNLYAY